MEIFDYNDYRRFLAEFCEAKGTQRGFQASLAKAAGCQASYFSQVLKHKVHLTEDQTLGLAQALTLTSFETDYLLLLLRLAKAGTPKLRDYLQRKIQSSKEKRSDLGNRVYADRVVYNEEELGRYVSTWIPSTLHLLTSSEEFQTAAKMSERLQIPLKNVKETLDLLMTMGLVKAEGERFVFNKGTMHIPKDSPWQSAMQASRRYLATKSIALNPLEAVHFSSIFTISKEDREKVKEYLSQFIENAHQTIQSSGTEDLCCLCLDFFEVV